MIAWPVLILYLYGLILIVGGTIGYIKAKTVPSLIAGTLCGVIAIWLGYIYVWHFAPHCALALSLLLILLMGSRYLKTRKPMPALMICVVSLLVAVVQLYVLFFTGTG